jgi:hypothetical protein
MTEDRLRRAPATHKGESDASALSAAERCAVLSALWIWRAQLGRIGSETPVPGLGTESFYKEVDEIARKLGGDPDAYFFGLDRCQRR